MSKTKRTVLVGLLYYVIAFICIFAIADVSSAQTRLYSSVNTLDAIRQVETGGLPNDGRGAVGDGGRAIGPYQIHNVYHVDAAQRNKRLKSYRNCLNSLSYSEKVISSYMERYASKAWKRLQRGKGTLADVQTIARIHNGGPRGHTKKSTEKYWKKVLRVLV